MELTCIAGILLAGTFQTRWMLRTSLKVLRKAISDHGVNSDQDPQFTCPVWVEYIEQQEITISMDGKGKALDNIWIGAILAYAQTRICLYLSGR